MTWREQHERAERGVAELLPHVMEAGYGLAKAAEWGISPKTVEGWFRARRISTGHLFGTPEGVARNAGSGKAKRRAAESSHAAKYRGRCGVTGKPCREWKTCMYGGSELKGRADGSSKLETCARAVNERVNYCRECSRKKAGKACDWRCFKTALGWNEAREELVWWPQRKRDKRDAARNWI